MICENIEKEVVSLELSKKLRELKIKQESLCFWISGGHPEQWFLSADGGYSKPYHPENISAFTATEIMDKLPPYIITKYKEPFNGYRLYLRKLRAPNIQYIINYECDTYQFDKDDKIANPFPINLWAHNIYDEKLADCLAKALIHILETIPMEHP